MRKLILSIAIFGFTAAIAAEQKYPVSAIPDELKKDVNVVIREDHASFTIHARNKATWKVFEAITIFNEHGKRYATEVLNYDKLRKVTSFKGSVYDANGKLIKKLKSTEIYDQSAFDGVSLYSDSRIKVAKLEQGSYPYTVEFEYEIEFKYLFMIPGFVVVPGERVSVQQSSYQLIFPTELAPRYKTLNINIDPEISKAPSGLETVTWNFKNITPLKLEPFGPPVQEIVPQIMAAPTQFEFDGYAGNMDSWEAFGQWIATLNKGRNDLTESAKQKVLELTAGLKSTEEKAKVLYEYMQNKTRYVSIQLGIGGFQPFEASLVEKTGYGDCKALSNYMVSMLEVAGIKSHYALIMAGRGAPIMKTDFPSSQFNHAVVAVPNGADTLWLECTSQTNPFGYSGSFTGDRKALIITDDGAAIVQTPKYTAEQNVQSRTANVILNLSGDATAKIKTTYSGLQYENGGLNFLLDNQYDEQKKWLREHVQIPSFDINSFSMTNVKDKIPTAVVSADLTLKRFASVSGKRIFITPNLTNRSSFIPEKLDSRKSKVIRRTAFTDMDTIIYQLPEGIYPEFLPEPIKIKSQFGEYDAGFTIDEKGLIYVRRLKMYRGEFPTESYSELTDFYKSINKADNQKLVFLSKT
jgi:hypothetical protein